MVPSMCPGTIPVLCRCPDRSLGLRCRCHAKAVFDEEPLSGRNAPKCGIWPVFGLPAKFFPHRSRSKALKWTKGTYRTLRLWLSRLAGEGLTGRDGEPRVKPFWRVPRSSRGSVQVPGATPGPAPASGRGKRPQLPETERTPQPTRARSGPQTAPCANGNTPPATQSVHVFPTASPAQRQRHCRPGRFLLHGAHSVG